MVLVTYRSLTVKTIFTLLNGNFPIKRSRFTQISENWKKLGMHLPHVFAMQYKDVLEQLVWYATINSLISKFMYYSIKI
ncbi:MAG: hypothetical protein DRO88_10215 [Promethearchaeia archaeon]|nr:MAG: hypothetical protein DRO88_10215 [Candidatus Lokiarchaeia archaeon]